MKRNLTLLTDLYELTMANTYFELGLKDKMAYFDYFFRKIPNNGGYCVFAGLEQLIEIIQNFRFEDDDIKFLENKKIFSKDFLNYLKDFKFKGNIYSFNEGDIIFNNEPILVVHANLIDCQILETILLITLNFQSLIATKSSRIVNAAKDKLVVEFGSRRAQSYDASIYGARAAYITGCFGTSNVLAEKMFKMPSFGTMAHSYIETFDSEYEAFLTWARLNKDNIHLLIDTYDTIKSGMKNIIRLNNEYLIPNNLKLKSVRIDSGDLAYLSRKVRNILNKNGLKDTKIVVSNSLDEYLIKDLLENQKAKIDMFGVGERLITSKQDPILGGVYKLVAIEDDNKNIIPKIKVSENTTKTTTPGFKQVYRLYDKKNMAIADLITLYDEEIDTKKEYTLFDPEHPYKEKVIKNFKIEKMLKPLFINGVLVRKLKSLDEIKKYHEEKLQTFWDEIKRLEMPSKYYVDLSLKLYNLKQKMIKEIKKEEKDEQD